MSSLLLASLPATLPLWPIPGARNCSCTLGLGVQSVNRWSWLRLSNPHRACPARRRPMSSQEWNIHSRRPIICTLIVVVLRVVAPKGGAHGVQGCPMQKASGTGPALSIRPRMGAEKRTTFPSSVLRRCRGSHSRCFHACVGHEWMDPTSAELRRPPDVRRPRLDGPCLGRAAAASKRASTRTARIQPHGGAEGAS